MFTVQMGKIQRSVNHLLQVVVREYADEASLAMVRGGPGASSHVEVLRNQHFLQDLLHAAAGWYEEVDEQRIESGILEVAERAHSQD